MNSYSPKRLSDRLRTQALATLWIAVVLWAMLGDTARGDPLPLAGDFVAHEVIVAFEPATPAAERARLRDGLDVESAEGLGGGNASLYRLPADVSVAEALRELRGSDAVDYAEPNGISYALDVPNDPSFPQQWALQNTGQTILGVEGAPGADIGAARAWDVTTGTPSTTIAVIDSGVALANTQLSSRFWANPGESGGGKETNGVDDDGDTFIDDVHGWDFTDGDGSPQDLLGHGTGMAGAAGAAGNDEVGMTGAAQNARLMPLRVSKPDPAKQNEFPHDLVIKAINFAGSHEAKVVNMSFGGETSNPAMLSAINAYPDTLFVAAAGNEGGNILRYPCAFGAANLLCVAATDNRDRLASFSNYNATAVDIGSPGVAILQPQLNGSLALGDGTSPATAITSGAMALYRSQYPADTPLQVIQRVKETVDPVLALVGKTVTGGRLDIGNALDFTAPDTTITGKPASPGANPTPGFVFTSNESGVTFQCQVDSGGWATCQPGGALATLPDGSHTFEVAAEDGGRNVDPTPATDTFTVDTDAPETTIKAGPPDVTYSTEASFEFDADEPSTFKCSLDGGPWQDCTSPVTYFGLPGGQHQFRVRATDVATNQDPSPATFGWTVNAPADTQGGQSDPTIITSPAYDGPPLAAPGPGTGSLDTVIAKHPPRHTRKRRVTFVLEGGASYRYRVDSGKWATARTARLQLSLRPGSHRLLFQAVDAAGALDPTPEKFSLIITKW